MVDWHDANVIPEAELGEAVHVWVCVKNRKGTLVTQDAYYVNHPMPTTDDDDEYPDWASLNCDGEPADFIGFAKLTSHPDYDGYYEPLNDVVYWTEMEYPTPPAVQ